MYLLSKDRVIFLVIASYFIGSVEADTAHRFTHWPANVLRILITAVVLVTVSRFILRKRRVHAAKRLTGTIL